MERSKQKHYRLYVLKLEQGKFYIGVTAKAPEKRMREHQNGFLAANWTKRYKPVRLFYTKDLGMTTLEEAEVYEGRVTRKYMDKYGLNNVRGGDLAVDEEYRRIFKWLAPKSVWSELSQALLILFAMLFLAYFAFDNFVDRGYFDSWIEKIN